MESHHRVAVGVAAIRVSRRLRPGDGVRRLARPVVRPQDVAGPAGAPVAAGLVDALVLAVAVAIQALVHV